MGSGCCRPNETCTETINIAGMSCGHCAGVVESALKKIPGVIRVAVDLKGGKAEIEHTGECGNAENFIQAVNDAGYKASV